jgi:hypothetical protein
MVASSQGSPRVTPESRRNLKQDPHPATLPDGFFFDLGIGWQRVTQS